MSIDLITVYIGVVEGNALYDTFMVGKRSKQRIGHPSFNGKIVERIELAQLTYTKHADIYYTDGSRQSVENVKQVFYAPDKRETPAV